MIVFSKKFKVEDRVFTQHILTYFIHHSEIQSLSLVSLRSIQGLLELLKAHLIVEFPKVFHIWPTIDQIIQTYLDWRFRVDGS